MSTLSLLLGQGQTGSERTRAGGHKTGWRICRTEGANEIERDSDRERAKERDSERERERERDRERGIDREREREKQSERERERVR